MLVWGGLIAEGDHEMSAMKELYTEAVEEFQKWEDEKYGDKTPLADMHVDMWVEAYMLGYVNAMKGEVK